jgi:DNA-binding response OmpR family regulator
MGRTIVVVEDEQLIAESVAARLRAEGLEVEIANDGPTGVEICRRVRPDLVILDLMLPGYDGRDGFWGTNVGRSRARDALESHPETLASP